MGVRGLKTFLEKNGVNNIYQNMYKYVCANSKMKLNYIVIAVDFSIYAYKFKNDNLILGLFNQIIYLKRNHIIPIYILDGKPPINKMNMLAERKKKKIVIEDKICTLKKEDNPDNEKIKMLERKIIYITKQDIENAIELFTIMGITYLTAKGESDVLCGQLYKENIINCCLTEDTDVLLYGCDKIIKINDRDNSIIESDINCIIERLNITIDEFYDMCILFGCDYTINYINLPSNEKFNLIKTHISYESIVNNLNLNNIDKYLNEYDEIMNIYINSKNDELDKIKLDINMRVKINFNALIIFLNIHIDKLNVNLIKHKIDKI